MSLIDYQRKTLCPEIWDLESLTLKQEVENFIIQSVEEFFHKVLGVVSDSVLNTLVKDILIASSLASYFYNEYSDLDIKIVYSPELLSLETPEVLEKSDVSGMLTKLGRLYILNRIIPNTNHQLDPFFISEDDGSSLNLLKFDSLYSVFKKTWLKAPKHLSYKDMLKIIETAKEKAQPFLDKVHEDIEELRRDSIDFMILYDYLKTLPTHQLMNLRSYINDQIDKIESDLQQIVSDQEILKGLRSRAFSKEQLDTEFEKLMNSFNYSDENLIYKFVTRYGYLKILSTIKYILEKKRKTK